MKIGMYSKAHMEHSRFPAIVVYHSTPKGYLIIQWARTLEIQEPIPSWWGRVTPLVLSWCLGLPEKRTLIDREEG